MNKLIMLSVVVVFVVCTAVGYLIFGHESEILNEEVLEIEKSVANNSEPKSSEPSAGNDSLSNLLARAENLECSIIHKNADGGDVTGTYFTSRGMMRGDFMVPGAAAGSVSSMIIKDNTLYSWSVIEGETYGISFDLSAQAEQGEVDKPDTKTPVPLETPVSYDCKPWLVVDGSIFEVPSDVIFRDFATVMSTGMEYGTVYEEAGETSAQCQLCEKVEPGEGQDECKKAFKCQ